MSRLKGIEVRTEENYYSVVFSRSDFEQIRSRDIPDDGSELASRPGDIILGRNNDESWQVQRVRVDRSTTQDEARQFAEELVEKLDDTDYF